LRARRLNETSVVVLGAGPAGLGAALGLAEREVDVRIIERRDVVGGNAGSFELGGMRVDYGSHRLHPAADPAILDRLRTLLGDDLLARPRHGRIRLLGRWVHFPLRGLDLALRLPPSFALGALGDAVRKALPSTGSGGEETFASVLESGLGRTICRDFYFPYARKIWGVEPEELSYVQAYRRVSAGSISRLIARLLPGRGGKGSAAPKGIFYYPRRGYGQISECLHDAAVSAGASVRLGTTVRRVSRVAGSSLEVEVQSEAGRETYRADHVWSTIPLPVLVQLIDPPAPEDVLRAAKSLDLRAMVLVYLVLDQDRFTEYDAHYFPGTEIPFTRLSEPKNYSGVGEPRGRTVLCAEIPCSPSDAVWSKDAEVLRELVLEGLARAGLPVGSRVLEVEVCRLPAAYPIYRRGYETHFASLDEWLQGVEGVLSFGRQGLFAHDNTHHALYMAQAAVECLRDDGSLDRDAWGRYREIFETHVVED
jgi:protoporphyrinogen oxidase